MIFKGISLYFYIMFIIVCSIGFFTYSLKDGLLISFSEFLLLIAGGAASMSAFFLWRQNVQQREFLLHEKQLNTTYGHIQVLKDSLNSICISVDGISWKSGRASFNKINNLIMFKKLRKSFIHIPNESGLQKITEIPYLEYFAYVRALISSFKIVRKMNNKETKSIFLLHLGLIPMVLFEVIKTLNDDDFSIEDIDCKFDILHLKRMISPYEKDIESLFHYFSNNSYDTVSDFRQLIKIRDSKN